LAASRFVNAAKASGGWLSHRQASSSAIAPDHPSRGLPRDFGDLVCLLAQAGRKLFRQSLGLFGLRGAEGNNQFREFAKCCW